jgi:hypothetical protein
VRSRQYLVENRLEPPQSGEATIVRMCCLERSSGVDLVEGEQEGTLLGAHRGTHGRLKRRHGPFAVDSVEGEQEGTL